MAAAAATAAKLIERMLAIFGRCSEIVMGRPSRMGRKQFFPFGVIGQMSGQQG